MAEASFSYPTKIIGEPKVGICCTVEEIQHELIFNTEKYVIRNLAWHKNSVGNN